jgi:iron complex transport system substrate-binding protein
MQRTLLFILVLGACCFGADPPRRIVSLSPNMTEILYGIGAFDSVAGVSDYCTYPPSVRNLPSVGGWHTPSLEKLAALRPGLVVLDDAQAPFVENNLRDLGLRVMVIPDHSLDDVYAAIGLLGRATGHEAEAAKLAAQTREGLLRVSRKTASLPKPDVILIVNRTPGTLRDLYTATQGSFLAELIDIAGGRIAAPAMQRGYGKLSKEDLLAIDPAVILDFIHGSHGRLAGDPVEAWREMPELKAVRTKRIYGVGEDFVPHASQRIVQTAELFARLLHPGVR